MLVLSFVILIDDEIDGVRVIVLSNLNVRITEFIGYSFIFY